MFRPRIIPCLLLKNRGLVKSVKFNKYRYIGDPMNAVKIFNEHEADELIFLDIDASKEKRTIPINLITKIGEEAFMPFAVGGGIRTIEQMKDILKAGAEKIILNTAAIKNPKLIKEASEEFGSSTIVVSIDVKNNFFKKERIFIYGGRKPTSYEPVEFAKIAAEMGAGEIMITSIENDGLMKGYDIELIKKISNSVNIPVIACGGAGNLSDFRKGYKEGNASALAAGSFFVYHGARKAVLISYPDKEKVKELFTN